MHIKTLRRDRGWSQEQLASMAGISTRTLQRIERGGRASPESLKCLAAVLDVDFADLNTSNHDRTDPDMPPPTQLTDAERDAIEYVHELKGFYMHLAVFGVVMVFLIILNIALTPGYPWVIWAALGWGVGIAAHALTVFDVFDLLGPEWEQREIRKRLEKSGF